ncbi:MAG: hypothetical protein PWP03_772 [Candidatus Woesearchaeota archaeon]|nr:hypothetical protein [Candidatus Woesearchaeota archaeon]MDN5328134.1 hypothetical protein [Candidatus Woesearchaeota archaeon]
MNAQKRSPARIVELQTIEKANLITNENTNYLLINNEKVDRVNVIAIVVDINRNEITNNILLRLDDGTAITTVMIFDPELFDENIKIGDFVNVIGRVREFEKSRYIAGEIIRKTTKSWFNYRKKLLEKIKPNLNLEKQNQSTNISSINQTSKEINTDLNKKSEAQTLSQTQEDKVEEDLLIDEVDLNSVNNNSENKESGEKKNEDKKIADQNNTKPINKDKLVYDLIKKLDDGEGADLDQIIIKSKLEDCEDVIKKLLREGEIYEIRPNKFKVL